MAGISSSLPATNFQDLSAVLSLLASDTVEKKLGSEATYDWERMSSVWSTFGMVGALRFYLKFAAGLSSSERAGVSLAGAGSYTAYRTELSLCYWKVNRQNSPVSWRDTTHQLLSLMRSSSSAWIRPIFIVIGYSRCPWNWRSRRCLMEIIVPFLWAIFSLAITALPTIILFPSPNSLSAIQLITLCLQAAVSIFAGTIIPITIHRLNSSGVAHLARLDQDRLNISQIPLIRDGDLVMSHFNKKEAHIVWKTPATEVMKQTGDIWWIRLLCAFSSLLILGAYIGVYITLGTAPGRRQYIWLSAQIIILGFRYAIWSQRPVLFPQRPPCLLYIATGSLVDPISAVPPPQRIQASSAEKLTLTVIEYAVAAAHSKARNRGSSSASCRGELLARMANAVPSDIISTEYVLLAEIFNQKKKTSSMTVLRFPWSFVEECYAAQGVILGHNPWAFGGLYLGAVFLDDDFVGLTTIHPFQLHVGNCADKKCAAQHEDYRKGGFTRDGYFITDLICGTVVKFVGNTTENVCVWHDRFRSNVSLCRSTARANGPSYAETHVSTFGPKEQFRTDISRVEPTFNYDFIRASALEARTKMHEDCPEDECEISTFGTNEIQAPSSSSK